MKYTQLILLSLVLLALFTSIQTLDRKRKHKLRRHHKKSKGAHTEADLAKYFFADYQKQVPENCNIGEDFPVTFNIELTRKVCDAVQQDVAPQPGKKHQFRFMAFNVDGRQYGGMQHPQDYSTNALTTSEEYSAAEVSGIGQRFGKFYTHQKFNDKYALLQKVHSKLFGEVGGFEQIVAAEGDGYEINHVENCKKDGKDGLGCSVKNLDSLENVELFDYGMQDFMAPEKTLQSLHESIAMNSKSTVAHCTGGTGRTGFVLAAMMLNQYHQKVGNEKFKQELDQQNKLQIFTVSRDTGDATLKEYIDTQYDEWWMKAAWIPDVAKNEKGEQEKGITVDYIMQKDQLTKEGEKYYSACTGVVHKIVSALRCVYKSGAVEAASQVRKLDEYANFLATQNSSEEQLETGDEDVSSHSAEGSGEESAQRLSKKSKKHKKSRKSHKHH